MPKEFDRELVDLLLSAAKESQNRYWDDLSELERVLDCEVDGETIATHDVDSLITLAEGEA